MHPEISCPSEHNLSTLFSLYSQVFSQYNNQLTVVDRRTGGQGAKLITQKEIDGIFKDTILTMMNVGAGNKIFCGLSDNSIFERLPYYSKLLKHPPIICIVRNPIDMGLSSWRHNHRLATEENNDSHLKIMPNNGKNLESWLFLIAKSFNKRIQDLNNFSRTHNNIKIIKYEDLVVDKKTQLSMVFKKIGVGSSGEILDSIVESSNLETMSKSSNNSNFFGMGSLDFGEGKISKELKYEILNLCATSINSLGYSY